MTLEQSQEMVKWLEYQIAYLESSIGEAEETKNYGRKIQHQGMKDAYAKCLMQMKKHVNSKKKVVKSAQQGEPVEQENNNNII